MCVCVCECVCVYEAIRKYSQKNYFQKLKSFYENNLHEYEQIIASLNLVYPIKTRNFNVYQVFNTLQTAV